MRGASKYITELLGSLDSVQTLIIAAGGDGPFWEIGPEEPNYPMLVYTLSNAPGVSKDAPRDYEVEISAYSNADDAPMTIASEILEAIDLDIRQSSNPLKFIRGNSGFTEDNQRAGFATGVYAFRFNESDFRKITIIGTGTDYSGNLVLNVGQIFIAVPINGTAAAYLVIPPGAYSVDFAMSEPGYTITTPNIEITEQSQFISIGIDVISQGGSELLADNNFTGALNFNLSGELPSNYRVDFTDGVPDNEDWRDFFVTTNPDGQSYDVNNVDFGLFPVSPFIFNHDQTNIIQFVGP